MLKDKFPEQNVSANDLYHYQGQSKCQFNVRLAERFNNLAQNQPFAPFFQFLSNFRAATGTALVLHWLNL